MIFNDRMEIIEFEDKNNLYIFTAIAGAIGSAVIGKVLSGDDDSSAGGTTPVKPTAPDYISQSTPKTPQPPSYGGGISTQRTGKQGEKGGLRSVGKGSITQPTVEVWESLLNKAYAQAKSTIKVA